MRGTVRSKVCVHWPPQTVLAGKAAATHCERGRHAVRRCTSEGDAFLCFCSAGLLRAPLVKCSAAASTLFIAVAGKRRQLRRHCARRYFNLLEKHLGVTSARPPWHASS